MDVSVLEEPRNPLSNRHSSLHVILFSSNGCSLLVDEIHRLRFGNGLYSARPKTCEVLNGALFMAQNVAERVSRLRSRTDRFPWSFSSLNLSRSYNQLATAWPVVEILYASSGDRICLYRREWSAWGARDGTRRDRGNGAFGESDIEGKAAMGSGERPGK